VPWRSIGATIDVSFYFGDVINTIGLSYALRKSMRKTNPICSRIAIVLLVVSIIQCFFSYCVVLAAPDKVMEKRISNTVSLSDEEFMEKINGLKQGGMLLALLGFSGASLGYLYNSELLLNPVTLLFGGIPTSLMFRTFASLQEDQAVRLRTSALLEDDYSDAALHMSNDKFFRASILSGIGYGTFWFSFAAAFASGLGYWGELYIRDIENMLAETNTRDHLKIQIPPNYLPFLARADNYRALIGSGGALIGALLGANYVEKLSKRTRSFIIGKTRLQPRTRTRSRGIRD